MSYCGVTCLQQEILDSLGTTIVTGSSQDTDGFAFPPPATLQLCLHLTHRDTKDTHKHVQSEPTTDWPHLWCALRNLTHIEDM